MIHPYAAQTDYPFWQLGDSPNALAPMREVTVLNYDGNKYATIDVCGIRTTIKLGYLYDAETS